MMMYLLIFGGFILLSLLVSSVLKSKFKKYSKIPTEGYLTGKEVAEKMLRENGITDVSVTSVAGQLTDHYNPVEKTINLSRDVYYGNSVAAAAVAAHETGHALQHARAYSWLTMRSKLVPVVSFASRWVQWILLAGIILVTSFPQLLLAGIILFAATTLFSVITLPVEVDASRRALVWLESAGITNSSTHYYAQDALRWAASTYFIAAIASLATLAWYIMIFLGARD
ncbi:MAG TPA: zinc metallopeptidase [Bacteroidales bacterium]|nr:zinc metallopeptidase [Bacteroidales bacterium]HOE04588.1 zinc metallopeptidase [Bacteroidales bacterium]HQL71508.1 zinc metallopeptidase [Bacteroidales bacterium]